MMKAYSQSKLALIMMSFEWAERLRDKNVTVNVVHPGPVATRLGDHLNGFLRFTWALMKPFLLSPEKGAATTLYVATSPELERSTGQYFIKKRPTKTNPLVHDAGLVRSVWNETERLCETGVDKADPAAIIPPNQHLR